MKTIIIGAKGGVGSTSFALLLAKTIQKSIYVSLNFGRKDASASLDLPSPIYDLYDACNRGALLEDCILKGEGVHLLEGPLLKKREDLDLEGLKKVLDQLEETYDHIFLDLGPSWKDLEDLLEPEEVYFLSSPDRAGLYAMDQVKLNNRLWGQGATFVFTCVKDPKKLLEKIDQEGLSLDPVKTLPRLDGPEEGQAFFYPQDFAKIYTDQACMDPGVQKKSLWNRLLRG